MTRSTSTAWLAYIVAQQHRWPPQFPQPRTLLTDHGTPALDVPADRGAWTAEHWQAYAEFLEQRGAELARRVRASEAAQRAAPRKRQPFPDWLSPDWTPKARPGRPVAATARVARDILAHGLSAGWPSAPARMIDLWNSAQPRPRRVQARDIPAVKSAMARIRKSPHKYMR